MGYSLGYFSNFWCCVKMAITRKIEVRISSNFLHSLSTSIYIRKCNKNLGSFRSHFLEKTMGYSLGYFSNFWCFLKMAITRKIEVRISSNFLHSLSTSIYIRKCNKNLGSFRSHFLEKTMGYSLGYFSNFWCCVKMAITRKIEVRISSNFLHSLSTSIYIRKCNKNLGSFRSHFLEKTKGYSLGYFSNFWCFLKMAITRKIEVRISSNFLHSLSTSIYIRKWNKNLGSFRSHFLEKTKGYSLGYFSNFWCFLKMAITRKIEVRISSNFLHSLSTSIYIRKCNKNLG